ncbi:MAG TPA: hypothetical protein VK869_12415 [Rubrobacteraceae bacterium]|nr:hypothetical protein [Rubrobacteraceae bacterium]
MFRPARLRSRSSALYETAFSYRDAEWSAVFVDADTTNLFRVDQNMRPTSIV